MTRIPTDFDSALSGETNFEAADDNVAEREFQSKRFRSWESVVIGLISEAVHEQDVLARRQLLSKALDFVVRADSKREIPFKVHQRIVKDFPEQEREHFPVFGKIAESLKVREKAKQRERLATAVKHQLRIAVQTKDAARRFEYLGEAFDLIQNAREGKYLRTPVLRYFVENFPESEIRNFQGRWKKVTDLLESRELWEASQMIERRQAYRTDQSGGAAIYGTLATDALEPKVADEGSPEGESIVQGVDNVVHLESSDHMPTESSVRASDDDLKRLQDSVSAKGWGNLFGRKKA